VPEQIIFNIFKYNFFYLPENHFEFFLRLILFEFLYLPKKKHRRLFVLFHFFLVALRTGISASASNTIDLLGALFVSFDLLAASSRFLSSSKRAYNIHTII
jgi:hypothetical protein